MFNSFVVFWATQQLLIIVRTISNCCVAQKTTNELNIDSAIVYKGFGIGGTTSNLSWNSNMLDTSNYARERLSLAYLDTLKLFMTSINSSKHYQQKVGPSYYGVLYSNNQKHRLAFVPDFGIIDLSTKRQYVLRDTQFENTFERFIKYNCR